jgi:predicted AlkP superfamily pyrophosphatase or phosphodiesterase
MLRRCLALLALVALPALAKPPKLTVFISIDSLGSDVFLRNKPRFKGGFARLLNEGAYFPVGHYELAECVTAIGHTTLSTGAWPWRHGVVGNRAWNRATGKVEAAFADPSHPVLEAPLGTDDVSPVNLLAETLSDHLRTSTSLKGKAVAISGKGRSAVALAGRLGDAWWFHEGVGKFVTGTWYKKEFPTWVKAFNDKKLPDAYQARRWELSGNPKDYLGDDERPFESDWYGMGRTFPHPLAGGLMAPGPQSYSALASSALMNEVEVEFAKAAIEGEGLGKDDVPDLLSISFSALDRTYHLYGPDSWEVQDHLLRLDKALGELLAVAEKAAGGKQNLVVVLSADHGGANIPEEWAAQGLDGVRVSPAALQKGLDEALEKRFGAPNMVAAIEEVDVYLDWKAVDAKKLDLVAVRRAAAQWLGRQGDLQVAVARDDLESAASLGGLGSALRHSFHPDRSGDVLMVMKPFHVLESEPKGTSHGTPWTYDSEVPIFFFGRGVKSGVYPKRVQVIDVAPTTAALMEMGAPSMSEGVALDEALALPK